MDYGRNGTRIAGGEKSEESIAFREGVYISVNTKKQNYKFWSIPLAVMSVSFSVLETMDFVQLSRHKSHFKNYQFAQDHRVILLLYICTTDSTDQF